MRLVILCSGQAGQRADMLDRLLGAPDDTGALAAASRVLGQDVAAWWHGLGDEEIFANANAQFAIVLHQVAWWQQLASHIPQPVRVAGYSVGELTAWHVAGALDMEETLRLAAHRARAMDAAAPSGGKGRCLLLWRGHQAPGQRRNLDDLLKKLGLEIAIHRPGDEFVIGGPASALDAFVALPEIASAQCVRLPVSLPSHTSWLRAAVRPWAEALENSSLADARIPVVAGTDGRTMQRRAAAIDVLSRQVAEPLRWDWISEDLAALLADVYLELGPGNDLSKQLQTMLPDSRCRSADEFSTPRAALDWILFQCRN